MKQTKEGHQNQAHIDKMLETVKNSLNDFERTQLVTAMIKEGNISNEGIVAIHTLT